jgi:hypothetical protein
MRHSLGSERVKSHKRKKPPQVNLLGEVFIKKNLTS